MPVLVVLLVAVALAAGFAWGRGTATAALEAERADLAVQAQALDVYARILDRREAFGARVTTPATVVYDQEAITYTCHADDREGQA